MSITGLAYPLQIKNGSLVVHTDDNYELVNDHIRSVIETEVGERLGLYDFGIPNLTFTSYPVFEVVGNLFIDKLTLYVPECQFQATARLEETGTGTVEILWNFQGQTDTSSLLIQV